MHFCEDKTQIISQNNKLSWHYSISFPKELWHESYLMKKGEYRSGMGSLWTTEKNPFFLHLLHFRLLFTAELSSTLGNSPQTRKSISV